jgi:hypothetical protein
MAVAGRLCLRSWRERQESAIAGEGRRGFVFPEAMMKAKRKNERKITRMGTDGF